MSTSGIPILFFLCFFPKKKIICGQRLYIILCLLWPIATTKTWPTILFVNIDIVKKDISPKWQDFIQVYYFK